MIVGLHGLKASGKDTVADYLVKTYGFTKFAFADAIYSEVATAFGVTVEQLRSREWKHQPQEALALRKCKDPEFVRMLIAAELPGADNGVCNRMQSPYCTEIQTCPRTGTFIVQRWGTDYRRMHQGNNLYWTNKIAEQIAALSDYSKIVLSDVRGIHEVEVMEQYTRRHKQLRAGVVQIIMPGTGHTGHSSDDALPSQYIDHIITNTPGDFHGLYQQVDDFIQRGIKWKQM